MGKHIGKFLVQFALSRCTVRSEHSDVDRTYYIVVTGAEPCLESS